MLAHAFRRLEGVTLAAEFRHDAPADFGIAPAIREPQSAVAREFSARPVFERPRPEAAQGPMADEEPDAPPDITARDVAAVIDRDGLRIAIEVEKRIDVAFAPMA